MPTLAPVDHQQLDETAAACTELIDTRFPDNADRGAAAMLLADGTILTGTAPDAVNSSVEVCHEIESYCGAFRPARLTDRQNWVPSKVSRTVAEIVALPAAISGERVVVGSYATPSSYVVMPPASATNKDPGAWSQGIAPPYNK